MSPRRALSSPVMRDRLGGLFVAAAIGLAPVAACKPVTADVPDQPSAPPVESDSTNVEDDGAQPSVPARPAPDEGTDDGAPSGEDPGQDPPLVEKQTGIPCSADGDCVPDACCHASSCVAAKDAPSCQDMMCTASCEGDTMDCGGGCACVDGACIARVVPASHWGP